MCRLPPVLSTALALTVSFFAWNAAGEDAGVLGSVEDASDPGVERFIEGDVRQALKLEQACAKDGNARCASLIVEMQEFQGLARKTPHLSEAELSRLGTLDRNISPHQWSVSRRRVADAVATYQCSSGNRALKKGDVPAACAAAHTALAAYPHDPCAQDMLGALSTLSLELDVRDRSQDGRDAGSPSPQLERRRAELDACLGVHQVGVVDESPGELPLPLPLKLDPPQEDGPTLASGGRQR